MLRISILIPMLDFEMHDTAEAYLELTKAYKFKSRFPLV